MTPKWRSLRNVWTGTCCQIPLLRGLNSLSTTKVSGFISLIFNFRKESSATHAFFSGAIEQVGDFHMYQSFVVYAVYTYIQYNSHVASSFTICVWCYIISKTHVYSRMHIRRKTQNNAQDSTLSNLLEWKKYSSDLLLWTSLALCITWAFIPQLKFWIFNEMKVPGWFCAKCFDNFRLDKRCQIFPL